MLHGHGVASTSSLCRPCWLLCIRAQYQLLVGLIGRGNVRWLYLGGILQSLVVQSKVFSSCSNFFLVPLLLSAMM